MKLQQLLLLVFSSFLLQAQDTTFVAPDLAVGRVIRMYCGDTAISEITQSALGEEVVHEGQTYTEVLDKNDHLTALIRVEGNKVYVVPNDYSEGLKEEGILYDYGLEVGDKFPIFDSAKDSVAILDSAVVEVVEQVEIYGRVRRKVTLKGEGSLSGREWVWLEGVGNIKTGIFEDNFGRYIYV